MIRVYRCRRGCSCSFGRVSSRGVVNLRSSGHASGPKTAHNSVHPIRTRTTTANDSATDRCRELTTLHINKLRNYRKAPTHQSQKTNHYATCTSNDRSRGTWGQPATASRHRPPPPRHRRLHATLSAPSHTSARSAASRTRRAPPRQTRQSLRLPARPPQPASSRA